MRTFVVGAGGTGGYFGGLLARAGKDVTFVARGEHFRAMRENGLFVKSAQGDFAIPRPQVIDNFSQIEDPELILIFVKTYSTQEVSQALAKIVTPRTTVITFQTELENDLEIKKHVPTAQVFPGLIYVNSRLSAPGYIEQSSGLCTLIFGARDGVQCKDLPKIETFLRAADIKATLSNSIEFEMWTKLIWISAFAGMTVLFRSIVGTIVNDPDGEKLFRRALEESFAIARAKHIAIPDEVRAELFGKIDYYKNKGRNAKTSMLLDIEAKRRTEIETMHGTLLRYAREANLDVPILESVYSVVKVSDSTLKAA